LSGSIASQPCAAAYAIRAAMMARTFALFRSSQYSPGQPSSSLPRSAAVKLPESGRPGSYEPALK
jgi:hypothetical protein